jgi:hypothetical protein
MASRRKIVLRSNYTAMPRSLATWDGDHASPGRVRVRSSEKPASGLARDTASQSLGGEPMPPVHFTTSPSYRQTAKDLPSGGVRASALSVLWCDRLLAWPPRGPRTSKRSDGARAVRGSTPKSAQNIQGPFLGAWEAVYVGSRLYLEPVSKRIESWIPSASARGISRRGAHRSGLDTLASSGSCHRAKATAFH